jgi:predicted O-methyltransferase YrrM
MPGGQESGRALNVERVIARLAADPAYLSGNWSLPLETARFLHLMARIGGCRQVLEVGTSIGFSTLHLASAAAENGGHVDTIEASDERQGEARRHIEEAGLASSVTFHLGDALSVLNAMAEAGRRFDLMFLDARKKEYVAYFELAQVLVRPGGIVMADNTRSHREKMASFIEAVKIAPEWRSCDLDTPNGFILARRAG